MRESACVCVGVYVCLCAFWLQPSCRILTAGFRPDSAGYDQAFFSSLASALWESDDHGFCGETV